MLLKKLWMVGITVVASLALANGAGVLARQGGPRSPRGEPDGQRTARSAGVEKTPDNAAGSSDDQLGQPSDQEDETTDRIESLRLDIELLTAEVRARMDRIEMTNQELVQAELADTGSNDRARREKLRTRLDSFRKDYFSKNKQLKRKQAELFALHERRSADRTTKTQMLQPQADKRSGINRQVASTAIIASTPSAPSGTAETSSALEKRLSGIDQKLDKVLKTLEELKHKNRE